ncbi:Glutathione S-transferase-like protein ustS [Psilocybe cubensis]|nr:Glutathione S-transferase-like protein ustS [Psilocybe cubensis]KAH9480874.1 Glutathione S-transferase-like protein ustS [Psilocybe cubensis]
MTIVLYDTPSKFPEKAWNFSAWKTRLTLNFKGIPYTTHWVEFPDIEPLYKKLGIPPSKNKPDGSPFYTIPSIYDPSTGVYISDSVVIADYLDKTYPDKPRLIPEGTLDVQSSFSDTVFHHLQPVFSVIGPSLIPKLNTPSADHMLARSSGQSQGPKPDTDVQWKAFEDGLNQMDAWYLRDGGKGPYLLGDIPSWGDIVMASVLTFLRIVVREDSKEWKDITSWNDGRWKSRSEIYRAWETSV